MIKIDIIDLRRERYRGLMPEQLVLVRAAQVKKNKLTEAAEKEKTELFWQMNANNVANSSNLELRKKVIDEKLKEQVELLKYELDYQLGYPSPEDENEYGEYSYPDNPNYSLSAAERFWVVHDYYMQAIENADDRLKAYAVDELAKTYLGQFYQTLYERFVLYKKQQS